jgi:hypothetical protein
MQRGLLDYSLLTGITVSYIPILDNPGKISGGLIRESSLSGVPVIMDLQIW